MPANIGSPKVHGKHRATRRARRGATAVEFAIAAPVVLLVVFLSFEFGRMNMVRHTIQDAAYEAARKGLVATATETDIRAVATTILNAASVRSPVTSVVQTNDYVTVTIDVNCDTESWVAPFAFKGKSMRATITLNKS